MTLHLDARRRAMLAEMGVRVWLPMPQEAPAAVAAEMPAPLRAPALRQPVTVAPQPQPQPRWRWARVRMKYAADLLGTGVREPGNRERPQSRLTGRLFV